MVFGSAELAGVEVVVPETPAYFAKTHYGRVIKHYVIDQIEWENVQKGTQWSEERMAQETAERLAQVSAGFERWMDEEARRNDGVFTIAACTPKAKKTAIEIARAGVVNDPEDQRWEIGEDPFVLGEALEAGAHWIASDNLKTLDSETMEEWLEEVQSQGRFLHVPRPFILTAEAAVGKMLNNVGGSIGDGTLSPREQRRMLANALSRPADPNTTTMRRVQILSKMGKDIRNAGLRRTYRELHQWQVGKMSQMKKGSIATITTEIEQMDEAIEARRVTRTRAAEDRRRRAENTPADEGVSTRKTPKKQPGGAQR